MGFVPLQVFPSSAVRSSRCTRPRRGLVQVCANAAAVTEEQAAEPPVPQTEERLVPGTPFTKNIMVSPMRKEDRYYYITQTTDSVGSAVRDILSGTEANNTMIVTMLLPELNPSNDIYDRRLLLMLSWEIIIELVQEQGLKVKVMTQSPTKFGGLPLSVAGLRRHFEGDQKQSAEDWGDSMSRVKTADIDVAAVEDDDDAFVLLQPTNTVSAPVIDDVIKLVPAAGSRPVIMINPRLADFPSHSGVMQVQGRKGRQDFMSDFWFPHYFELLYPPGKEYPIRGVLRRQYPGKWELWHKKETMVTEPEVYTLMEVFDTKPSRGALGDAFRARMASEAKSGDDGLPLGFSIGLLIAGAGMTVAAVLAPTASGWLATVPGGAP